MPRDSYVKPLSSVHVMVAHDSVANSKPKVKLDSYADTCVVGDNCLVILTIIDQLMSTVMIQKMAKECQDS